MPKPKHNSAQEPRRPRFSLSLNLSKSCASTRQKTFCPDPRSGKQARHSEEAFGAVSRSRRRRWALYRPNRFRLSTRPEVFSRAKVAKSPAKAVKDAANPIRRTVRCLTPDTDRTQPFHGDASCRIVAVRIDYQGPRGHGRTWCTVARASVRSRKPDSRPDSRERDEQKTLR